MKNPDNENKQDRIEPPQLDTVVRTFTTVPEYVGCKEANSISLHRVCTWWRCVLTDNLLPVSSRCSLLTPKSDQDGIKVLLISFHLNVGVKGFHPQTPNNYNVCLEEYSQSEDWKAVTYLTIIARKRA